MTGSRAYKRYAVYAAPPPDSDLGCFGNAWLGRNPSGNIPVCRPDDTGLSAAFIAEITQSPARYGFHATLKAPFTLAEGLSFADLDIAVSHLAGQEKPVTGIQFILKPLGPFLALVPAGDGGALHTLCAACVRGLEPFRAPLTGAELARRRQSGLTDNQDRLLLKWGYPYVMDEFRFHMTLTDKLAPETLEHVAEVLRSYFDRTAHPVLSLDSLCLFGDPGDGKPFDLVKRYALTG